MADIIGNQTILPDVLKSLNAVPTWGESEEHWGKKPPLWVNDVTQLNEENMNALSNGILKLQTNVRGLGDQSKQALKDIINSTAGWKSSIAKNAEVFNDYSNNLAVGEYSHSEGQSTLSGMRGYYVGVIDQKSNFMLLSVEETPVEISAEGADSTVNIDGPTCGYSVGSSDSDNKFYCFISGENYDSQVLTGKITLVNGNRIEFEPDNVVVDSKVEFNRTARVFMHKFPSPSNYTTEIGTAAHSEGVNSHATGDGSHSEGVLSHAFGAGSHSEGYSTLATGMYSHAEGYESVASGHNSHAEGFHTIANGRNQHVQGRYNKADLENKYAHILGGGTSNQSRKNIHTVDWNGNAWYLGKVVSDDDVIARIDAGTEVTLKGAHTDIGKLSADLSKEITDRKTADNNLKTELIGSTSDIYSKNTIWAVKNKLNLVSSNVDTLTTRVGGCETNIAGINNTLAEKLYTKDAVGKHFLVDGEIAGEIFNYSKNTASGKYSHAEGKNTNSNGFASHAEGEAAGAGGYSSHAEGFRTTSSGFASHSEGSITVANGRDSHSEGIGTVAYSNQQHVQGRYNVGDADSIYAHIVGNGTSDSDRKNIHALDWEGNAYYSGDVYVGGSSAATGIRMPVIYSGTEEPLSTLGKDGDIYIKYVITDTAEVSE